MELGHTLLSSVKSYACIIGGKVLTTTCNSNEVACGLADEINLTPELRVLVGFEGQPTFARKDTSCGQTGLSPPSLVIICWKGCLLIATF